MLTCSAKSTEERDYRGKDITQIEWIKVKKLNMLQLEKILLWVLKILGEKNNFGKKFTMI